MVRRTIYETTFLILLAVTLSVASYLLRPDALPLVASEKPAEQNGTDLYASIPIEQAKLIHEKKAAVFADARSQAAYREGRIKGAVHLDPYDFDAWSVQITEKYPLDTLFITYCDGPQCPLARTLAEKLTWLGYEKVYYLVDGWGQWQKHGLPIAMGESD